MSLPEAFLARIANIVPEKSFQSVLDSFSLDRRTGFRINPLIGQREDLLRDLTALPVHPEPVPWFPDAFSIPASERAILLDSDLYRDGSIYIQNHSSMVPPLILSPQPGQRVLDLTAAPGSKTLQLAAMVGPESELAAVEVVRKRFFKLRDNLKRNGAGFVRTFLQDGTKVWRYRPEHFDCVLLDAPCSSEARFNVDTPSSYAYWSERKVREMARKQYRLLVSGLKTLATGGHLVYSTCSFAPEENEMVLDRVLGTYPGAVKILPITIPIRNFSPALTSWQGTEFHPETNNARRILPDENMEGFFVAHIHKISSLDETR